MSERFGSIEHFSQVIFEISSKIPDDGITFEGFLDIIGERGIFMSCMILTAPFLLPVSVPGMSIPFGSAIFLLSLRIIFNKPILIPERFMKIHISNHDMVLILNEILNILTPLEKYIKPRLCFLVTGSKMNQINGMMLAFGAILLVTPIIAPLGDFIPSYGILFICLGTLERDGYLILAGYATVIGTAIYYILIFAIGIAIIIIIASHLGIHL
ncbi:MAG TPA: exopolysaccharide biosynthesis protein [Methanobacterium sp.]